jgi:hypothetical protein
MGWSVNRPTGLTYHQSQRSTKGYTLITPAGGDSVYLIDMEGRIVHRWRLTDVRPAYARLLDDGKLLLSVRPLDLGPPPDRDEFRKNPPPFERRVQFIGGHFGELRELDWEGNMVWQYVNNALHHDYVRLENGNTLFPEFVELPEELHKGVRGGGPRRRGEKLPPLISDDLVEIDHDGNEVRRIHIWKLLDPKKDTIEPMQGRWEWTHTNGIDVNEASDIVFSARQCSRVGIIDGESEALRWKYAETALQHNPTWVGEGNVQIFDNGRVTSRIVEINPENDEVVWSFRGQPAQQFFSGHISGAQRLANNSVVVCEGSSGRLFEVTRDGEVVWEWINPFTNLGPRGGAQVTLYRAHRYLPDHPALAERELDAARYRKLNELNGLM